MTDYEEIVRLRELNIALSAKLAEAQAERDALKAAGQQLYGELWETYFATPRVQPLFDAWDAVDKPPAEASRGEVVTPPEQTLRERLWINHGCPVTALYGDDGEMQCNALTCRLDFKRTPLAELCSQLIASGRLHAGIVPDPQEVVTACPQCRASHDPDGRENDGSGFRCWRCDKLYVEPAYYQRVTGPHVQP